jgi:AcrR family transcriptional regulator
MRAAGLTHGGFYAHFPSKEALVAEVSGALLQKSAARWSGYAETLDPQQALRRIVEPYLSPDHADSANACVLTTLSHEAARRPSARHAMDAPLHEMLAALRTCLPDPDQAPAALATMVGAVTLARMTEDPALAEQFLSAATATVLPASGDAGKKIHDGH